MRKIKSITYNDSQEAQNIKPEEFLNHPLDNEHSIDTTAYDALDEPMTESDKKATGPLQKLYVSWQSPRRYNLTIFAASDAGPASWLCAGPMAVLR